MMFDFTMFWIAGAFDDGVDVRQVAVAADR